MQKGDAIFIAGHRGLAGSAIYRYLKSAGYTNLVTRTRSELDLQDKAATGAFFAQERPAFVFLAAAKVGGIVANSTYPADFVRDNLAIQSNVIEAAYQSGVKRLLFLGSSCIYPKLAPQPISERALLTGPLEATNRAYAVAKIAGIEMCWGYNQQFGTRYLAAMPTNLYGPGDNFDLTTSHVLPALIRKAVEAKRAGASEMVVWGTGKPLRELMHSDDLAAGSVFLLNLPDAVYDTLMTKDEPPLINIGTGADVTIRELAEIVASAAEFEGKLVFDATKPDGTPRKLMDSAKIEALGWKAKVPLVEGVRKVTEDWAAGLEL